VARSRQTGHAPPRDATRTRAAGGVMLVVVCVGHRGLGERQCKHPSSEIACEAMRQTWDALCAEYA